MADVDEESAFAPPDEASTSRNREVQRDEFPPANSSESWHREGPESVPEDGGAQVRP